MRQSGSLGYSEDQLITGFTGLLKYRLLGFLVICEERANVLAGDEEKQAHDHQHKGSLHKLQHTWLDRAAFPRSMH